MGKILNYLEEKTPQPILSDWDSHNPQDILSRALSRWHPRIAVVTSFQMAGMVLLDMCYQIRTDVRVITIDTGRLPSETYEMMERVRAEILDLRRRVHVAEERVQLAEEQLDTEWAVVKQARGEVEEARAAAKREAEEVVASARLEADHLMAASETEVREAIQIGRTQLREELAGLEARRDEVRDAVALLDADAYKSMA